MSKRCSLAPEWCTTVAAAWLLVSGPAFSQPADPEPAAIDAIFSEWNGDVPGVALAIVRDEEIIYSRGYGIANLDHAVPIAPHTAFDIASTSKQFTAACILLLAEEGKLALNDDVRLHIPEFPRYEQPITIAHLLHHTSGLRDYTALMLLGGHSIEFNYSQEFLLDLVFRQKGLNFTPGERFSYSNTGYFLLGEIVKRVSGMPLSRFARERIFEPLGMHSTVFLDDHTAVVPNRAESYLPREDGSGAFVLSISLMDNIGDGGIFTTVEDLAKWDANFYHNRLGAGKPEFLDRMHDIGLLNDGRPTGYASGLFIGSHRGLRMVSHSGGWRGFRTEMLRFPDQKLSVICLSNLGTVHPTALALQVADLYLPESAQAEPAASPRAARASSAPTFAMTDADLDRFVGRYKVKSGPTWTISRGGEGLAVQSTSGLIFTARPIGPLEFESTDRPILARLVFGADEHGRAVSITQTMAGAGDVHLARIEPLPDPAAGLNDFVGVYESEELDSIVTATVKDGQLWFVGAGQTQPYALNRESIHEFSVWGFDAIFSRGNNGKVDGFILNSAPASGIRFVRREPG